MSGFPLLSKHELASIVASTTLKSLMNISIEMCVFHICPAADILPPRALRVPAPEFLVHQWNFLTIHNFSNPNSYKFFTILIRDFASCIYFHQDVFVTSWWGSNELVLPIEDDVWLGGEITCSATGIKKSNKPPIWRVSY